MAGVSNSDDEIRLFIDDRFQTRIDKAADFWQSPGCGRIVAVSRDADETRTETQRKYRFSDAGGEGNDPLMGWRFSRKDACAA